MFYVGKRAGSPSQAWEFAVGQQVCEGFSGGAVAGAIRERDVGGRSRMVRDTLKNLAKAPTTDDKGELL